MIIKLIDLNNNSKVIQADSFEAMQTKANEKFGYKIESFISVENDEEIVLDDAEIFEELVNLAKSAKIFCIKIMCIGQEAVTDGIPVTSLTKEKNASILKKETTYGASAKIVPKPPGDLSKEEKEDNSSEFFSEISAMQSELIEINDVASKTKQLEEKLKKEKEKILKIEKRLKEEKAKCLNKTLETERRKKDELLKELNKLKYETEATREIKKTELIDLEYKVSSLKLKNYRISKMFNELRNAEKVDICFLLDCTGSMAGYISEAKTVIHRVVDKLGKQFQDLQLNCAFIGYRDHSDGVNRISRLPFTKDKEAFKTFVSSVSAMGGADECEDIFGGLEEVTKLTWTHMSRILFHIGDAPCHGSRFHSSSSDSYPAGDPRGLNITDLLRSLVEQHVEYYFAEINGSTAKMIAEFNKEMVSMNGNEIKVVKMSGIGDLLSTVAMSITSTIMHSKSLSMHSAHGKPMKSIAIDSGPIDWSTSKMKKVTATYWTAQYNGNLDTLKCSEITYQQKSVEMWIAHKPFAKGGLRYAFAALVNLGTASRPELVKSVLKESIFVDKEYNTAAYYKDLIEIQVIAKFLASEYAKVSMSVKSMKFIDVNLVQEMESEFYYSVEEYVDGTFKKWMNNAGVINEEDYACTLNSFSHWTFVASNEYLLVTDLQGFENGCNYVLTDPAITCLDDYDRFTSTNLGKQGLKKFFESHQCNNLCENLLLKRHKHQLLPNRKLGTCDTKFLA